jgi:arylsulfatase A-like enzyme
LSNFCSGKTSTLFTGQYWSRHRSEGLNRPVFYQHWNTTWPYLLQKQRGYYIGHVGKWQYHHPEFVKKNYDYAHVFEGFHWIDTKEGTKIHAAEMTRNSTLDFLRRRPKDRPFAVTVAFYPPKAIGWGPEQWFPKNETKQLYQNITIPEPVDWNASYYKLPEFFRRGKNEGRMRWKQRFGNYSLYQNSMKSYYALITQVDDACREIVDELKKQDILDKTLLIFTADNGFFHGEHGLAGKWFPYQESIRVPLIIRDPRMPFAKRGTLEDAFTLNVDLAPTILGAANLAPPPGMQGRDIAELYLASSRPQWRTEFFYEHPSMGRLSIPASSALVRKDYKYMYYKEHRVERLFDLINDPLENEDIKNLPQHAQLLQEMRTRHGELKQQVI